MKDSQSINCLQKNNGQAMLEFIIVFPVLFVFILCIIQISVFYVSKHIVHYAAYKAVRAAIVWLPEDVSPEKKIAQIKKAAAITCMPISPISSMNPDLPESKGIMLLEAVVGGRDLAKRYHSSNQLITINILDENGQDFPVYQDYDENMTHHDVTIKIVYYCPILIPVIKNIFSSLWKSVLVDGKNIYAFPIREQCTLPLEGNVKHGKCCN